MSVTKSRRELSLSRLLDKTPLECFKIIKKPQAAHVEEEEEEETEGSDKLHSAAHRAREVIPKTRAELNQAECRITVLSLRGLQIERIHDSCFEDARFGSLHRLDLSENSLVELPGSLKLLRLTYLDISKNPELCCEGMLKGMSESSCAALVTLNVSDTRVGEDWNAKAAAEVGTALGPSVKTLIMKECRMEGAFSCAPFTSLQSLIISHNPGLKKIELSSNGHPELTKVSASSNVSLRKMGKLKYARNLKELRLNACPGLKDLSAFEVKEGLSNLTILDLSGCELIREWKDITERLCLSLDRLESISVRGTPLHRRFVVGDVGLGGGEEEGKFEEEARVNLSGFTKLSSLNSRPFVALKGSKSDGGGATVVASRRSTTGERERLEEKGKTKTKRMKTTDSSSSLASKSESNARGSIKASKETLSRGEEEEEEEEGEELNDLVKRNARGMRTAILEGASTTVSVVPHDTPGRLDGDKNREFDVEEFVRGLKSRDDDLMMF